MRREIETVEDDFGKVTTYHRHPNGGGLLGPGVHSAEDSFIADTTYIEAGGKVGWDSPNPGALIPTSVALSSSTILVAL